MPIFIPQSFKGEIMSDYYKDPEHDDYDDDDYRNYPQEYNEYGYPKSFKFDWSSWELWLKQALEDIVEENNTWTVGGNKDEPKFPVSGALPKSTFNDKYFMYLGSNHYDEAIWKTKYFVVDDINKTYKGHILQHAVHFLKQPAYYKGMFDILN